MRKFSIAAFGAYALPAFASGGDVLSLAWLQVALLVSVLASLSIFKLSASKKVVVFAAYLAALLLSAAMVWNVPYTANEFLVAAVSVGIPFLAWLGCLILALHGGKNITSRWRATR